jgi:hypothetical protein
VLTKSRGWPWLWLYETNKLPTSPPDWRRLRGLLPIRHPRMHSKEAPKDVPVIQATSRITMLEGAHPYRSRLRSMMKTFLEQSIAVGEQQKQKQPKKSMEKVSKRCSFESDPDSDAEDDARLLALDLDSPATSTAISCAEMIAAVKKTKPVEVEKKSTCTCTCIDASQICRGSFEIPG